LLRLIQVKCVVLSKAGICQRQKCNRHLKEFIMKKMYLMVIALIGLMAGFSLGASAGDAALENTLLNSRLNQLEKQIQELKQNTGQQPAGTGTPANRPVWSTLDIEIYGYLKLDASYDTSLIYPGNNARWVNSEEVIEDRDQFNMTANETRLGVKIKGPNVNGIVTSGLVEIDFYGGGTENRPNPMMRKAYIELAWPQEQFSILAGQTSDVISPLYPTTINYTVCWFVGNIGYRRPQFRLTKEFSLPGDVDLKLEGAVTRTIGRSDDMGIDSGQEAGFPTLQGRVSTTFPLLNEQNTTIGISGHKGTEQYTIDEDTGETKKFYSWSLNLDASQPIIEKVKVQGEFFTGENLDAYLGGIGQGVTIPPSTGTPVPSSHGYSHVHSTGGWVEVTLGPWHKAEYNVGFAMDRAERGDVYDGDRIRNRTIFSNVIYALNKQTDIGFELSHWRTEYRNTDDGNAMRLQAAVKYKF
jgi:hypothetical protein